MPDITGNVRPTKIDKTHKSAEKIRALNDRFRKRGCGGVVAVTLGVRALGFDAIAALSEQIREFDEGNEPYGEHDMGVLTYAGNRLF